MAPDVRPARDHPPLVDRSADRRDPPAALAPRRLVDPRLRLSPPADLRPGAAGHRRLRRAPEQLLDGLRRDRRGARRAVPGVSALPDLPVHAAGPEAGAEGRSTARRTGPVAARRQRPDGQSTVGPAPGPDPALAPVAGPHRRNRRPVGARAAPARRRVSVHRQAAARQHLRHAAPLAPEGRRFRPRASKPPDATGSC